MNRPRWHALLLAGTVVAAALLASEVGPAQRVGAAAQPGSAGPQTWQVLVNNISPEGQNWSFTAFYPDQLQAHPGDTIVFTLAPNPTAYHAVQVLFEAMTPMEFYQGINGGFRQPDLTQPGGWQSSYFGVDPRGACGRGQQNPCPVV